MEPLTGSGLKRTRVGMRKNRAKSAVKSPSVVSVMKAESQALASQIADLMQRKTKLDDAIAIFEGKARRPQTQQAIITRSRLPKSNPFFGLSLPEAATKQLSTHTSPKTARQLWQEMQSNFPTNSADPIHAVQWALQRRALRFDDVILIGDGKWGMSAWYSEEERKRIKDALGPMSGRDRENHIAKTKAGAANVQARGGRWGAPKKMTAEKISKIRQLIEGGLTVVEACKEVGISPGTFTNYNRNGHFAGLKLPKGGRKKRETHEVDEPDLLNHNQSKVAIN